MILRFFAFCALLVMAAASPFWLTGISIIIFSFCFRRYFEAIFVSLLIDFAYGRSLFHVSFVVTILCVVIIFIAERVKREIYV